MITEATHLDYQAYTLRLWQVDEQGGWRATLYNPHTGRRQSFASCEQLCTFLQAVMSGTTEDRPEQDV